MNGVLSNTFYILSHYAYLGLFVCAFWGIGQSSLSRVLKAKTDDPVMDSVLAVIFGQGIFIVFLQCLALGGQLQTVWLHVLLVGSGSLAIWEWHHVEQTPLARLKRDLQGLPRTEALALAFVLSFAFPTLLESLRPPWPGDELHYHMPHVQQWAESGKLTVNDWLRYPWFPFNFNLLYAAAYVVFGDVFTHMFNTLAGWLVAVMIYRLGVRHFSQAVACLATFIWFHLNRGEFGITNVDMGVTLYVVASSIVFFWWLSAPTKRRWLLISAFLMGVAVGAKYQALFFLPFFGIAILWKDRKISTLMIATASLLAPCVYWYARNAVLTGDPFNPIGGKVFGFTDWNLADFDYQFADLKRVAAWPSALIWPAVFAVWYLRHPRISLRFWITILSGYFVLVWLATSRYPRYLMPVVPWLALLAAEMWIFAYGFVGNRAIALISQKYSRLLIGSLWIFIFSVVSVSTVSYVLTYWSYISPTSESRNTLMRTKIKGFEVLEYAHKHPMGRIYNVGLSDAVYYAPHPIWGDVFGPWRYQDILSADPKLFFIELKKRDFDAVIMEEKIGISLESNPAFKEYFSIEFEAAGVRLYRVKGHSP